MAVYKNDIGTIFEATITDQSGVAINISSATTITFKFKTPDGSLLSRAGTLHESGTTGKCCYTTVADDLNQTGEWFLQVYIAIGPTTTFHTSATNFVVDPYFT